MANLKKLLINIDMEDFQDDPNLFYDFYNYNNYWWQLSLTNKKIKSFMLYNNTELGVPSS